MGIRIHKVLGYGLDDCQFDNGKISDDRIRNSFFSEFYEDNEKYSLQNYLQFLQDKLLTNTEESPYVSLNFGNISTFSIKMEKDLISKEIKKKQYIGKGFLFLQLYDWG